MTRGDAGDRQFRLHPRPRASPSTGSTRRKVVAIPRGVDLAPFDPAEVAPERVAALRAAWGVEPDDPRVKLLLAGRLTRWKGQRLLIEAAARLKAGRRATSLILLAGDDQGRSGYRAELEAAIAAAGLGDSVRLVGHCDDMPAAYLRSPTSPARPRSMPEAFGRTAVEPQAMGRPVLAADHGAPRETVVDGETGWLVAARRRRRPGPRAIGERDRRRPAAARAAMGAAARARARRLYSLEAMCEATLAVYARRCLEAQR